jgi:hypothetical protein
MPLGRKGGRAPRRTQEEKDLEAAQMLHAFALKLVSTAKLPPDAADQLRSDEKALLLRVWSLRGTVSEQQRRKLATIEKYKAIGKTKAESAAAKRVIVERNKAKAKAKEEAREDAKRLRASVKTNGT